MNMLITQDKLYSIILKAVLQAQHGLFILKRNQGMKQQSHAADKNVFFAIPYLTRQRQSSGSVAAFDS